MRLTAIILLTASLAASATGHSQRVTLSLKNATLEQAFSAIEKQAGVSFIYGKKQLEQARPISINISNETLENVLDLLFKNLPLTYTISGKYIAIKQKQVRPNEPATVVSEPPPPSVDVKGKIVNEKGEPVAGASILIKGSKTQGTSTNANGEFELKDVDENAILVISGVSIETFDVKINGKSDLGMISAKTKISEGEEVVIEANTGYQKVKPNEVTGSLSIVDNKLFNRSVGPTVLERLEAVVPGLIFNRRIGGGSQTSAGISIRGISTLESDQKPLIVLDNFPYDGDINNINPNDVESITVLRDAAATSIWGARAGNGVIVITTNKGKYNQPLTISVNNNITVTDKPDLFYQPAFPAHEFIGIENFLFHKGYFNNDLSNINTYPVVSPVVEILSKRRSGLISAADSALLINALLGNDIRKDYDRYMLRSGINYQHALSLSGGAGNTSYLMSAGYDKMVSSLRGNDQERISIRTQIGLKPVKNLEIAVNTLITQNKANANSPGVPLIAGGGKGSLYPYARLVDEAGNHLAVERDYRTGFKDTAGNGNLLNWNYNPLDELELGENNSRSTDILINTTARYHFFNWLSAELNYQIEKNYSTLRNYSNPESYTTRNLINIFTPKGESYLNSAIPFGGILDKTTGELRSNSGRAQININKNWSALHQLNSIVGAEIRELRTLTDRTVYYGYDDETATYKNVDYLNQYNQYFGFSGRIPNNLYSFDKLNRFISFYGNASYIYKGRYNLSVSGRKDASNLFGTSINNKWKPLWSAGAAWELSKESFYKFKAVSYLKIRSTFGYAGNVNNTNPALLTINALSTPNPFTNLVQYSVNNPPNPTLRWEKNRMINFGIDFSLTSKVVSGSIDYYLKKSTDLISQVSADITTGFTSLVLNSAELDGKGLDVELQTRNINGKLFNWNTNFIFSFNTNKVAKYLLPNLPKDYLFSQVTPLVGENAYSVISRRWAGLDPANGDPRGHVDGQISSDYVAIAASVNPADYVIHGSSRPKLFGALRNSFSYGNFSLSANISYRFGYFFRRNNFINYSLLFSFWNQTGYDDYSNRWQKPGDETHTNVPSLVYPANTNRDGFYGQSEATVEKGDHIRLNDISISYSLTKDQWNRNPFKQLNFFIYLNNLGIIWKATDAKLDPDFGNPPPKSYAAGLRIDL